MSDFYFPDMGQMPIFPVAHVDFNFSIVKLNGHQQIFVKENLQISWMSQTEL